MNILVIYDSEFGNTAQAAKQLGQTLEAYGNVQLVLVSDIDRIDVQNIDLLLVGSPTQYHGLDPKMHALLETLLEGSLHGIAAAAFDTRYQGDTLVTGSAAENIAQILRKAGAQVLVPAKSFFVVDREGPLAEEELTAATQWISTLMERFKIRQLESIV